MEVLPRKLDWVVLEFTIIRKTAAEGVKISVYFMRRLLSSLFNLAKMISILTMITSRLEIIIFYEL